MREWLSSNTWFARLTRTITQGIIGVLIANVDFLVSGFNIPAEGKAMIVALIMAILSPIMATLGGDDQTILFRDDEDRSDEGVSE